MTLDRGGCQPPFFGFLSLLPPLPSLCELRSPGIEIESAGPAQFEADDTLPRRLAEPGTARRSLACPCRDDVRDISDGPAPFWILEDPAEETELVRRREKRELDVEVVEEVRGRPFGVDVPLRLVAEDL